MKNTSIDSKYNITRSFPANTVIDWYLGNFIESPNNEIRDDSFDADVDSWKPVWFDDIEAVRNELNGKMITYSELFRLMKQKGIHGKYYHFKKYKNTCEFCKALGVR